MTTTDATQEVNEPTAQTTQEVTPQAESSNDEKVRDPEAVLSKNRELLGVIKGLKEKLGTFETEKKQADEAKLKEEGKLQELLTAKENELNELKPIAQEHDSFKKYFEDKLDKAKDGLSEIQIKAVDGFQGSLAEKVAMAEEFKGVTPPGTSPGAQRPSSKGVVVDFNVNDYLGKEGTKKLNSLYYTNRELYEKVVQAKKNII